MSEQQGWAPDPADQQGRASSPAAPPATEPASTTTGPSSPTPPGGSPADGTPADAASFGTTQDHLMRSETPPTWPTNPAATAAGAADVQDPARTWPTTPQAPRAMPAAPVTPAAPTSQTAALGPLPAVPGSQPAGHDAQTAVPGSQPAVPGSQPAVPGSLPAVPGSQPAALGSQPAAPAVPGPLPAVPGSQPAVPAGYGSQPAAYGAPGARPGADGPIQTWPASQPAAPQAGNLRSVAQSGPIAAGQNGPYPFSGQQPAAQHHAAQQPAAQHHAAQHHAGQYPGGQHNGGQQQPHLPTAQLPPHVPHMQRPFQWQQPQPGSVFVPPPVRRRSRVGLAVAGIVAAIGLSAVSAFGGGLAALELRPAASPAVVGATNSSGSAGSSTTLSDVAAQVLPSVVSISTGNAVGSGVVITDDGAILTNNHVVATARGTSVQVTFSGGRTAQAKIIGTEPATDLAVVKIVGGGTYTPLVFGDSSTVKVGDTVLAVGSPLGLDGSVTAGIVSAVNRTIDEGNDGQSAAAKISGAIQTDAAINPGNSGGALVNTAGQLVGINTAIATSGDTAGNIGVGFAISSNTAKAVAQRLLS
ncbi:S1C family serine protease [Dactylosporangium maewongense]